MAYQTEAAVATSFQAVARPAQRVLRFVSSSLTCTLVDQAIAAALFSALTPLFGAESFARILIASVAARLVSLTLNFSINNKLVFEGKDARAGHTFARFLTLAASVLALSSLGVWWAHTALGAPESVAKICVDGCLFFVNYNVQRHWVFRTEQSEVAEVAKIADLA